MFTCITDETMKFHLFCSAAMYFRSVTFYFPATMKFSYQAKKFLFVLNSYNFFLFF